MKKIVIIVVSLMMLLTVIITSSAPVADLNKTNMNIGEEIIISVSGVTYTQEDIDVVVVTDLSGSMAGSNKIDKAKDALKTFVDVAVVDMNISLASYSNADVEYSNESLILWNEQQNGSVPYEPYLGYFDAAKTEPYNWHTSTYVTNGHSDARIDINLTKNKADLYDAIDDYAANGGTSIASGINAALVALNESENHKVIIVMSDGISTMAPISPDSMLSYMPSDWASDESDIATNATIAAAQKAKDNNITIWAVGYGGDADTETLKAVASDEDKYFAPDTGNITEIYTQLASEIQTSGQYYDVYVNGYCIGRGIIDKDFKYYPMSSGNKSIVVIVDGIEYEVAYFNVGIRCIQVY